MFIITPDQQLSMFIYITWKNKDGKDLKTMVDHTKVDTFLVAMIEHGVEPAIDIPELDEEALQKQSDLQTQFVK
ncbi:MAG: hypothetical protein CL489_11555 [Acidobacteria bacterium]|nr:hypothetical protein [Acidobacteriota bacterium]